MVSGPKKLFRLGITQKSGNLEGVFEYTNKFINADEDGDTLKPDFGAGSYFIDFEQVSYSGVFDIYLPELDKNAEYIISTDVNDTGTYRVRATGFDDINGTFTFFKVTNGTTTRWRYDPPKATWWKVG